MKVLAWIAGIIGAVVVVIIVTGFIGMAEDGAQTPEQRLADIDQRCQDAYGDEGAENVNACEIRARLKVISDDEDRRAAESGS